MTSDKTPATVSAVQGQENQIDPADTLTDRDGPLQVGAVAQADAEGALVRTQQPLQQREAF